jgi:GNAT superfamily N-acetyltransferase
MNTLIRQAGPSDVAALVRLSRRTISASYRPFLGDQAVDAFLGGGAVDQYVRENIARCWVLLGDGAVVGYAVCRDNLIDLLMIDHAVHRRGLGSVLLKHVEGALLPRYGELRLESFEGNEQANDFYRKNGWLEAGRRMDADTGAAKIEFRKAASL